MCCDTYSFFFLKYQPRRERERERVAENETITGRERMKLEDLKVLRRSPDLFNNVKIGQGQLPLILIKHILFYHIWGLQPFRLSDLKQSYGYSIKQPSDF